MNNHFSSIQERLNQVKTHIINQWIIKSLTILVEAYTSWLTKPLKLMEALVTGRVTRLCF